MNTDPFSKAMCWLDGQSEFLVPPPPDSLLLQELLKPKEVTSA